MPKFHLRASCAMALMLATSCAKTPVDPGQPFANGPQATPPMSDVVVTGSRAEAADQAAESVSRGRVDALNAPPPPPPPTPTARLAYAPSTERKMVPVDQYVGRDKFTNIAQNAFKLVREDPVSTFSIDVDTASYSFVRASLARNLLPQPAAVRTEEMINYFPYDYTAPAEAAHPFTTNVAVMPSPWTVGRKIVRIGIKGYEVRRASRPVPTWSS